MNKVKKQSLHWIWTRDRKFIMVFRQYTYDVMQSCNQYWAGSNFILVPQRNDSSQSGLAYSECTKYQSYLEGTEEMTCQQICSDIENHSRIERQGCLHQYCGWVVWSLSIFISSLMCYKNPVFGGVHCCYKSI